MRRTVWLALMLLGACVRGPTVPYEPRDRWLKEQPLFFYPARRQPARAFVFFIGNDIGFWKPHAELAVRLSQDGYDVVGFDFKKFISKLPSSEPARDSSFAASIVGLIARARADLQADSLPAIVGGHSSGAEIALWIASRRPPPGLVGVLAVSPRSMGHLFVTPLDVLNKEASGPWAFSTIDATARVAPAVRIALVRGGHDPLRRYDSAFAVAGGPRFQYYDVPLAGHSMRKLLIAGPIIENAVSYLVSQTPAPHAAAAHGASLPKEHTTP